MKRTPRLVVTGGPGGGKTTAADLFQRELGGEVLVVPETATILFAGGFPRSSEPAISRATQRAVFYVQRELEIAHAAANQGRALLCDRGTLDGLAYWPGPPQELLDELGTTVDAELARYDAVLFFESAARGNHSISSGNRWRTETRAEAVELDDRLRTIWSQHPRFHVVPHQRSFLAKVNEGVRLLRELLADAPGELRSRR